MKSESLVIADQHAAVNTFPGLVHTARHTDEARELVTGRIEEDENGEYSYSQKWHLYVSYIGFKEVASLLDIQNTLVTKITISDFERSFSISKIQQKEFKKWIMKEATSDEDATWEQVKEAVSNCRK